MFQFAMLDYQRIPEGSWSMNGGGRQLMAVGDLLRGWAMICSRTAALHPWGFWI